MLFTLYNTQGITQQVPPQVAATVGVFDGVHRGHRNLLQQTAQAAPGCAVVAVTLTSHPSFVLGRRQSELWLDDADEHRALLLAAGADLVAELPFTAQVAQRSACQMAQMMIDTLNMNHLLVGYDSRFGSRTADDFGRLPQFLSQHGVGYTRGQRFAEGDMAASSSAIRHALREGDVEAAANMLGRNYTLRGTVAHGRGVGHQLGYATANVDLTMCRKIAPADGVYAVRLSGHAAVANLGAAPTFGVNTRALEVHILDFNNDIYNTTVEVEFVRRIRGTQHFASASQLQQQLARDVETARLWL